MGVSRREDLGNLRLRDAMAECGLKPGGEMRLRCRNASGGEEVMVCSKSMAFRVREASTRGWLIILLHGGWEWCWRFRHGAE